DLSKLKGGTYNLYVTDAGCAAPVKTVQIYVSDPDLKIFSSDDDLCSGSSATLFANSSAGSYTWNTAAITSSIVVSPTISTSYTVSVTDSSNCFSKKSLLVSVINPTIQGFNTVACGIPGTSTLSVKAFTPSFVSW